MQITREAEAAIRRHGEEAYPEECCGFLLGRVAGTENEVHTLVRAENRAPDERRTRRYAIPPETYLAAERAAEEQDMEVVGFYHSHPDHPARPSETDLAEATFPGYSYVIVSVREGEAEELTTWSLAEDRSHFEHESTTIQ